MRNYETIFVVHPDLREEYVQSVVSAAADLIRRTGGEVLTLSDWGNKKLNYQIKHLTRGRYFHLHYTAGANTVNELERNLRISDRVFRYLSSRVDEEIEGARVEEASTQKLGTFDGIEPDFGSGGIEHLLRERPVEVPADEEEGGFGLAAEGLRGRGDDDDDDRGRRGRSDRDADAEGGDEDVPGDAEEGGKE